MAGDCCASACSGQDQGNDPRWRRALWIALAVNAVMFVAEMIAGYSASSKALQADALDFFGDSANYAISLGVAGMALGWRARAALLKAVTLVALGLYVLGEAIWAVWANTTPQPHVMTVVGLAALIANGGVALMLYRFRSGDANRRSVWICSRNDAIGNVAVIIAAMGILGTGTGWPDLFVAAIMATLAIWGGTQIILQAKQELRVARRARSQPSTTMVSGR